MIGTIVFVALMLFLIRITDRDTGWWCGFVLTFGLLAKFGCELNCISLLVAMGVWKFIKDVSKGL